MFAATAISLYLSMAAFALAASITPGPVNLVVLSSGVQYGFRPSLRLVFGATAGFSLLLLLIGLGLHQLLETFPQFTAVIQWAGVAFLLFMAWKLFSSSGEIGRSDAPKGPSMMTGAIMQWVNPKAWLASIAGMGAYATTGATTGDTMGPANQVANGIVNGLGTGLGTGIGTGAANGATSLIWEFTAIYFVVCFASIACWAYAGAFLGRFLNNPARIQFFNRVMAALLAASAAYLIWG